jgi:hypothetical protein
LVGKTFFIIAFNSSNPHDHTKAYVYSETSLRVSRSDNWL